jgi:hypothetical protein
MGNPGNSGGTEIAHGMDSPGFQSRQEQDVVCTPKREDGPCNPPVPLCSGYLSSFQGVKPRGRDTEHSSLAPKSGMSGAVPSISLLYPPAVDNEVIFTFKSCM